VSQLPSFSGRSASLFFILCTALLLCVACGASAQEAAVGETADSLTAQAAQRDSATALMSATAPGEEAGSNLYPMSPERKAKLIAYSRFNNIWRFVSFGIEIGLLLLILFAGWSAKLRNLASKIKPRFFAVWLFLVLFLLVDYILNLPFSIYRSFIVESNYGFMNQTFIEWWGEDLLNLLIAAVVGIVPMWFFYWVVNKFRRWWLVFSIGAIPFAVLMIVIVPVVISPLFNDFVPLKNKQVESELRTLASKAGIEGADIFEVDASKQSTKINAYVTGLFGSKRIVLYDNILNNFTIDEIRFVMSHEMGHYVKNHMWWGLLLAIVLIGFMLWLMDKTIHPILRRSEKRTGVGKLSDIASLPMVLIFLSVMSFVFAPISNSVSRSMERACDKYGMDMSGVSGETAAIAFDKLSVFNLSDPDPNPIIEFWFYSHPALDKRMAFVRSYRP